MYRGSKREQEWRVDLRKICKNSMFATGKPVKLAMRASTDRTVASLAHDPMHHALEEERKSPLSF